ncbi:TPA: hypothetical protein AB5B86_002916 [Vibrio cholerae]
MFGFIIKATLYFVIFSIVSCLFIYAYAATNSAGETVPDYYPATYVPKAYKDTPVPCWIGQSSTLTASECVSKIKSYTPGSDIRYQDGQFAGVVERKFSSLVSGSFDFKPGVNSSGKALYCGLSCETVNFSYSGANAQYSESYTCPPLGHPEYIIHSADGTQCGLMQCAKDQTKVFDGVDMPNGAGYACNAGCEVQTFKPSTSTGQFGWQFIGVSTGAVCRCVDSATGQPSKSLNCWYRDYSPDGSGSSSEDKTCTAFDAGEIHRVNCGENGEMTVDLGPLNDSLVAQGKSISDLQTNDKLQNEYLVKNTNDIAGLKIDVDALKSKGCSVSQTTNGVTITCNGTSATAMNGKDGKDGVDGVNGARGADGAPGEKGEKGEKGDTGVTGATGEKGDKGDSGQDGVQGERGEKGDKGDTGATGATGVAGVAGRDGIDGQNGEDGEDGEGLTAAQDGIDVNILSAKTGARLATLRGIDRDGIVTELEKSNTTLSDINDKLEEISTPDAPTEVKADYSEKFKVVDPATRNFSTVLKSHVDQMKNTDMYQSLSGFFSVSFNGDCSPITFDFTVYSESFNISIDPFCNLTIWPYIRAVVMCVFGFFAFRVGFDN